MAKKIILTGDRPTGNLHIGHFVGALKERVRMQNSGEYEIYILIADLQALTDNANNPEKVKTAVEEIMLDYLAVGLDANKVHFVLQSGVPALSELTMYYMNIVTQARLERNPTVKAEIKSKDFGKTVPVGFVVYPISQASDITAFGADIVPVGADQAPMLEQTREIVAAFNRLYGETLVMPEVKIPKNKAQGRLVGTDGAGKMSKSLGNCIFIKDDEKTIKEKVMQMYTDPNHIKITDKGKIDGNVVFTYLNAFAADGDFAKYLPEYKNLTELKNHYRRGGLGDVKIKTFLFNILNELLKPMRERRAVYQQKMDEVRDYLRQGTKAAVKITNETLRKVRKAIGIYEVAE
jgi:tryptophanyl-tRNA synthetase